MDDRPIHFLNGAAVDREDVRTMLAEDREELVEVCGRIEADACLDGEFDVGNGIAESADDRIDAVWLPQETATRAFAINDRRGTAEVQVDASDFVALQCGGSADERRDVVADHLCDDRTAGGILG